jgi:hypothetical protein
MMVKRGDIEPFEGNTFWGISKLAAIISEMLEDGEEVKEFNGYIEKMSDSKQMVGKYSFRINVGGIDKLQRVNAIEIKEDKEAKYLAEKTDSIDEDEEF